MIYTLEMGYTVKEFENVLNGAFSDKGSGLGCIKIAENTWQARINSVESSIQISIDQKAPRHLGSLEIPILRVSFDFSAISSVQEAFFLDRFMRYFHKGGG
jgi:hypothetical protein